MANRSPDGRFAPGGGSHNPGGQSRYEKAAIKRCQEALEDSINELIKLTQNDDANIRLKAISMVLDRGLGRPQAKKDVDVSGEVEHEHAWSPEAFLQTHKKIAAKNRLIRQMKMDGYQIIELPKEKTEPKVIDLTPQQADEGDRLKLAYAAKSRTGE